MENKGGLIYPDLSYKITGILFEVHNEIGRYGREVQYSNFLEKLLKERGLVYKRELVIGDSGNRVDFLVDDLILIEVKAKQRINREDYNQTQRYLQVLNLKLGLLVNFRDHYLKSKRIIKIDNWTKH